jgi:hypothetical protein
MIVASQNNSLADIYFNLLKNLNPSAKLDLISRLALSLNEENTVPEVSLESLFGAYNSTETAEEIIAAIKQK